MGDEESIPLRVVVTRVVGTGAVIVVTGQLNDDSQVVLRMKAKGQIALRRDHLILDLAGLERCDVGGLGALIYIRRQALAQGGSVRLVGLSGSPLRNFLRAGLSVVFPLYTELSTASANWPPQPEP
ncbi:STAS domain-containing protein [Streptomyces sp. NPDC017529]|uniref:STAS domain-containing protein n=1 Tax=Streptomyces sp. NPDC017529 TaxID=3365000 RepID=UPI0037BDCFF6